MSGNPEVHIHVHLHSELAEGDILTEHTYGKEPQANPAQISLDDSTSPEAVIQPATQPKNKREDRPDRPVAITPQTTHDQRVEIADYSKRNQHLVKVDKKLSHANKAKSAAERVALGLLDGYEEVDLRDNASEASREATAELIKACGHCSLECAIRGNFPKWRRIHESADAPKTADQESRQSWRRRLVVDAEAHCLPGQTKKTSAKKAA